MKKIRAQQLWIVGIIIGSISITGCSAIKGIQDSLTNFKRLQFKLGDVNNFRVSGVDISRISSISDVGIADGVKLAAAVASKQLPVSFRLNLLAKNPNDGTGTTQSTDLFIKQIKWTMSIDDRTTINGIVGDRIQVPGKGQTVTIPVDMQLDLMKFFGDKGYNDIMNLALALGGVSGSSSRLKLTARVTVETPLGDYEYPDDLTIINTQFTN